MMAGKPSGRSPLGEAISARLLITCRDRPGMETVVSGLLNRMGDTILALDQHSNAGYPGYSAGRAAFRRARHDRIVTWGNRTVALGDNRMKPIDSADLEDLSAQAEASHRLRANHNLHDAFTEPVQRMLNAFEPGTCVRPHRHAGPPRWELLLALTGSAAGLTFDRAGTVTERCEITAGGPLYGVEIPAATWHTLVALAPGTVLFELKEGPYQPLTDKAVAPWAPAEGEEAAPAMRQWLENAQMEDRPGPSF
ncbi:WbuC family cupin fold metalloprotein [Thiohalorhabdus sp.]|uniref:WbuC family cupin fold metalloprotein n=1 Tax=Thiohalorhabdus sp. TaxID=3094134 RepID=UPI002FC3BB1C